MRTLRDLVENLIELTPSDLHLVADMLSASCPYTAECLGECLSNAQQEWKKRENGSTTDTMKECA